MTPTSGTVAGGVHRFPVRVYFAQTDAFGIVYHASYLEFAEAARTELMRLMGYEATATLAGADGWFFALRNCDMDFRRPARVDDALEIRTRIVAHGGASLDIEQVVHRPADAEDLVIITMKLAAMTKAGRPTRLPHGLRQAIADFISGK